MKKYGYDKAGRSTSSKSIFLVSDMHCGAVSAIMWEPRGDRRQRAKHRRLKDFWLSMPDQLKNKTPTALVLNGEPINGPSKKQNGAENWTSDTNMQLDDAERLIKTLPYKNIILTRGSGYHSSDGQTNWEETLARKLPNVIKYVGMFGSALSEHEEGKTFAKVDDNSRLEGKAYGSQHTDFYLWIGIQDKIFSITHHIGFSRWQQYRTTGIASEMANIDHMRGRYFPENMNCTQVIRSHVHYLVHVEYGSQHGATTPCWKLPDGFMFRGGMAATNTHIGGLEILIEPNGKVEYNKIMMENVDYPKYEIVWL